MARKTNDEQKNKKVATQSGPLGSDFDDDENELAAYLMKTANIDVEALKAKDQIPFFIDSGSYALNWITTNDFRLGIPGTKTIMVAGESATGKSLITDVWLGNNIRAGGISYRIDVEDGAGYDFAAQIIGDEAIAAKIQVISPKTYWGKEYEKIKSQPDKLLITIERLTTILNKLVDFQLSKSPEERRKIMVTIDSVSQLTSIKEIVDIKDENDKRDMTAQQKMRALFRAITQMLRGANITLVGIAHMTANIGVMFGEKTVANAKGSGFGYNSSYSLKMLSSKEITSNGAPIGIKMKLKTTKNRVKFKGRETFLYLYFNGGIDRYGGLPEILAMWNIATPSAKGSYGDYKPETKFKYVARDGEVFTFTTMDMGSVIRASGREEELLDEMNERLNEVYTANLKARNIDEDDEKYLDSEDDDNDGLEAALSEGGDE